MSWQDNRTMTPGQYKNIIARLGLTQAASARVLGRSERTVHRYVAGEVPVHTAEALLLRAMVEFNVTPKVPPKSDRS
jgi:plasmid maintenance system antidote protein VapI